MLFGTISSCFQSITTYFHELLYGPGDGRSTSRSTPGDLSPGLDRLFWGPEDGRATSRSTPGDLSPGLDRLFWGPGDGRSTSRTSPGDKSPGLVDLSPGLVRLVDRLWEPPIRTLEWGRGYPQESID